MSKRLVLIDGSGFIFRAYHSLPPLTRADGTPVGAVYGFTNMLLKLNEAMEADYMAVIFDKARKTFRNEIYSDYKSNRPPPPEDLIPQFALVREATIAMNLPALDMDNYEADDLIALYTKQAKEEGIDVVIVSSDKDLMQLVDDQVSMYDPMKQKEIKTPQVEEKFGVPPEKVLDVLSLMGDSSDNVPGVPGIGPKTATELILHYGDLETLLECAAEIKQNKRRESLIKFADQARMSKELISLNTDFSAPCPLEELANQEVDNEKLLAFVREQNFKSLVTKLESKVNFLPKEKTTTTSNKNRNYTLIRERGELEKWVDRAQQKGLIAFDTETTSLDTIEAELVGFSLSIEPGEACYVPLNHVSEGTATGSSQSSLFDDAPMQQRLEGQLTTEEALAIIKPLLESSSTLKIGQNIKYDMEVIARHGISITPVADTMLLSYALNAGTHAHNIDELSVTYLDRKPISYSEVTGTGRNKKNFAEVDLEKRSV